MDTSKPDQWNVVNIVDGDTFDVDPGWRSSYGPGKGNRVRLHNVNAPELHRPGGLQAKERLQRLIGGKSVYLDEKAVDVYGRLVAVVYHKGRKICP